MALCQEYEFWGMLFSAWIGNVYRLVSETWQQDYYRIYLLVEDSFETSNVCGGILHKELDSKSDINCFVA
jgi:hypothetical protein